MYRPLFFLPSFIQHPLAMNSVAVPLLGAIGVRKCKICLQFCGKRPVCDVGRHEFKPSFTSVWGLMKDILLALEPQFPRSLVNTNTYSLSVVIIKNPSQDIQDARREGDWLAGKIDHIPFRARKPWGCSRMGDPPTQTRLTNQWHPFIYPTSLI